MKMLKFVEFAEAIDRTRANRDAAWKRAESRLAPVCRPAVRPSFALDRGASIFTIGSCFARNIEQHLARLGFHVPTLAFKVPPTEWSGRPNDILNKYTAPSIWQEIRWASDIYRRGGAVTAEDCDGFAYDLGNGRVVDNNLCGLVPVSVQRFVERRRQVYRVMAAAFSASCVVVTPGLAEAWYDAARDLYIMQAPVGPAGFARYHAQLRFVLLDFATSYRCLQDTIDEIRRLNPNVRFLVTTSPVPVNHTFTGDDVIVANSYAKSMLRAVCGEICANNEGVDYLPSYESVMLTRSWDVFETDRIHVTDAFVADMVARLTGSYLAAAHEIDRIFQASFAASADGDRARALELARQASEAAPDRVEYGLRLAELLAESSATDEAEPLLVGIVAAWPTLARARRLLARCRNDRGDSRRAARDTRAAIALEPASAGTWLVYGRLLVEEKRWADAHVALRRALTLYPDLMIARFWIAVAAAGLGRLDEAAVGVARAIAFDGSVAEFHGRLGQIERARGRNGAALFRFRAATALAPSDGRWRAALALVTAEGSAGVVA